MRSTFRMRTDIEAIFHRFVWFKVNGRSKTKGENTKNDRFDENNDGFIEVSELKNLLTKINKTEPSDEEIEEARVVRITFKMLKINQNKTKQNKYKNA